jgi:hypothetical protein
MESDVLILQVDPTAPGCNLTEITSPPSYEGRYIFNPNPFKITFKEKDTEGFRWIFHFTQDIPESNIKSIKYIEDNFDLVLDCFLSRSYDLPYEIYSLASTYIASISRLFNKGIYCYKKDSKYWHASKAEKERIVALAEKVWKHLVDDKKEVIMYLK